MKVSFLVFGQVLLVSSFEQQLFYDQVVEDKRAVNAAYVLPSDDILDCSLCCEDYPRCVGFGFHSSRKDCYLYHRFIHGSQEVLQSDPGMKIFNFQTGTVNIAKSKSTFASSFYVSMYPGKAVDGDFRQCFRSGLGDYSPYLVVDLDDVYLVTMVTLNNVVDDDYPERLHDVNIELFHSSPVNHTSEPPTCCASVPELLPPGPTSIKCQKGVVGKYVKIYIERSELLTVCEVRVFGQKVTVTYDQLTCKHDQCKHLPGGQNIAYGKQVVQSSTYGRRVASMAVDGNTINPKECSHTAIDDLNPWLQVDLNGTYTITSFTIFNIHKARAFKERLSNVTVAVYQSDPRTSQATPNVCKFISGLFGQTVRTFTCVNVTTGRFVRVQKPTEYLEICELQIYG